MTVQIKKSGFTLVEIMVAVSLFVVVAFIASSAFTSFTAANRRAQALRSNIDNLNFAMESIVLKIREGNNYSCNLNDDVASGVTHDLTSGSSCNPSHEIAFLADNGDVIKYKFADGTVEEAKNSEPFEALVSPQVKISRLDFYVKNYSGPNDAVFGPIARIVIQGTVSDAAGSKNFNLQTTISQRP